GERPGEQSGKRPDQGHGRYCETIRLPVRQALAGAGECPSTALISRNSPKATSPHSRPLPDCLKPPNGAIMSDGALLRITCPARKRLATLCRRVVSVPDT